MEYRNDLIIDGRVDVYPPSEDSILLVNSLEVREGEDVLEIGCGSGVVSIHCAVNGCNVTAVDINPSAVECTKSNAEANRVRMNIWKSDLFENVSGRYDTIVFNLPYLPVEDEGMFERSWAGGADGMGPLPRLMEECPRYLKKDGRVVVVVSSLMDQNKLLDLLSNYKVRKIGQMPFFFEIISVLEIIP